MHIGICIANTNQARRSYKVNFPWVFSSHFLPHDPKTPHPESPVTLREPPKCHGFHQDTSTRASWRGVCDSDSVWKTLGGLDRPRFAKRLVGCLDVFFQKTSTTRFFRINFLGVFKVTFSGVKLSDLHLGNPKGHLEEAGSLSLCNVCFVWVNIFENAF